MLIRLGFDIQFEIPSPVAMIALFHVHQTRRADLREPDEPRITPTVPIDEYEDAFRECVLPLRSARRKASAVQLDIDRRFRRT